MKSLQNILTEISALTLNIETNYPELYRSLDESPMTLPVSQHPHLDKVVMEEYLTGLKALLEHYVEEEKIKNKLK
ncbi:hypothetical protein DFQ10_105274 [Winogradskyella eximia]|uniref:Uncharacterized protein n=1 Tax=Winogradskyella eximia TaxID=262006 RepID=A0A3D9H2F2_9FLAO|nr:hypothetical protein [Winogradskyella eximia]RED43674.1 hypothetical protein DFQ10_105274 [Winogradskyella eximia]